MKKFNYSLSGVLRVRKIQEQQKRAEVARAIAEKNELSDKIDRLNNEIMASKKRLKGAGLVDINDYRLNESYLSGVKVKTEEIVEKIKELDIQIETLKKQLHQRILETRKLETHEDKEKQLWREESLREEQAEFDDIANSRRR